MQDQKDKFFKNGEALVSRISEICKNCGRDPAEVKLMAVTKNHPAAVVKWAAEFGLPCVGENRVREAEEKRRESTAEIPWELIGPLQSNKAKIAAEIFDRIQTIERGKIVDALEKRCEQIGKTLPVLLQVNAGEDPAKSGVTCDGAPKLLEKALQARHLKVEGLMTIAPLDPDPDVAKATFERLRSLRDMLATAFGAPLPELSMGMSGDLEQAIEAGSTLIRVGTALYGERDYSSG